MPAKISTVKTKSGEKKEGLGMQKAANLFLDGFLNFLQLIWCNQLLLCEQIPDSFNGISSSSHLLNFISRAIRTTRIRDWVAMISVCILHISYCCIYVINSASAKSLRTSFWKFCTFGDDLFTFSASTLLHSDVMDIKSGNQWERLFIPEYNNSFLQIETANKSSEI